MNILGFVPARGGSKGIPRKNMALLDGKPMIQYTVEAAQQSGHIADIFLSSDDAETIEFCVSLGLKVSYRRPAALASDDSPMIDAIMDGLKWIEKSTGGLPDALMLLQPTSPLRTAGDIVGAVEAFNAGADESLVSVHKMAEHPYECVKGIGKGWRYLAKPHAEVTRRQDYPDDFFFINGAIYLAKTDFLLREKKFVMERKTALYLMPETHGLDIDDTNALKLAEFYLKNRHQ